MDAEPSTTAQHGEEAAQIGDGRASDGADVPATTTTKSPPSTLLETADVGALAATLEHTLKALVVQVGVALRARVRLRTTLDSIRLKVKQRQQQQIEQERRQLEAGKANAHDVQADAATSPLVDPPIKLSLEELAMLQQLGAAGYASSSIEQALNIDVNQVVFNYASIERLCKRYNTCLRQLIFVTDEAKEVLVRQYPIALAREEKERAALQAKQEEDAAVAAAAAALEAQRQKEQEQEAVAASAEQGKDRGGAISIDDDDDDDDVPLAGRSGAANASDANADGGAPKESAIDLTDDSPDKRLIDLPPTSTAQPSSAPAFDPNANPAALLASLGLSGNAAINEALAAAAAAAKGGAPAAQSDADAKAQPMALDNFDFASFGLGGMGGASTANDGGMDVDAIGGGGPGSDNDALLNFNPDQFEGVDLSFLNGLGGDSSGGGGGGSNDGPIDLSNIDFSSLLGNNGSGES